ncbi:MAG: chromate transporter [Ruminococcaceae bacterium]|nr:chromate transporter [Oscillospiraceae bacterium]
MNKLKNSIKLFLTMFKIGLFTFGGGYAMLALLENEFVEKRGWLTKEEFLNMLAIAESTPGPIAINSATYIGYKTAGVLGSAFATLGVCLPSFIIIFTISLFFDAFLKLKFVQYAFFGIRACVIYLIASAGFKLFKGLKKNALSIIIFITVLALMTALSIFAIKFSTVFYILICGTIGLVAYLIGLISRKGAQK